MATSTCDSGSRGDGDEDIARAENIGRIITAAVKRNDVGFLTGVPEALKWHKYVHPTTGNTLLHIAVIKKQKEAFDYFVSISGLPLNQMNNSGETVLDLCFKRMFSRDSSISNLNCHEYFACELIRRGASADRPDSQSPDETLLHLSIRKRKVQMCKLLIQMGHDVNARNGSGTTPMWLCLQSIITDRDLTEMVLALLVHGADPTLGESVHLPDYNAFEHAVMCGSYHLQEVFFLFMIDDYTSMDVHLDILLHLVSSRSPLFRNTLEHTKNVIFSDVFTTFTDDLISFDVDDLDLLIQKCPEAMRNFFSKAPVFNNRWIAQFNRLEPFENDNDLARSIGFHLKWLPEDESTAMERLCFLLSYGLRLNDYVLSTIYNQFGCGDLLKFVLYVEIEPTFFTRYMVRPHLMLLYDVNCDLQQIFEKLDRHEHIGLDISELLHYFSNAQLRERCSNDTKPNAVAAVRNQPRIPLLAELARNVFRNFFIETFEIESARQFYTLVDKLIVAPTHKKIITYEKKLY